jgi:hypothetical protein
MDWRIQSWTADGRAILFVVGRYPIVSRGTARRPDMLAH